MWGAAYQSSFKDSVRGNGVSPVGWAAISITVLDAHNKKSHGEHFVCPISKLSDHLAAILLVGNTNILHINQRKEEIVNEVHKALQEKVYNWV